MVLKTGNASSNDQDLSHGCSCDPFVRVLKLIYNRSMRVFSKNSSQSAEKRIKRKETFKRSRLLSRNLRCDMSLSNKEKVES